MGDGFNEDNFRLVVSSICQFLLDTGHDPSENRVVVGFDTRRDSGRYAAIASSIVSSVGFDVMRADRDTPTPVVAFCVRHWSACGGIMITASHNPPEWNGVKFIPSYGGPADQKSTDSIRSIIEQGPVLPDGNPEGQIVPVDPFSAYLEHVRAMLDAVAFSSSELTVVYDPMHGTGRGYLDRLLSGFGAEVITINSDPDPEFGGGKPDPVDERLKDLSEEVIKRGADIGIATDGDADRMAAVGPDGAYIAPNSIFPLLAEAVQLRKRGGIVRSVATTSAVDALCEKLKVPLYEVPVGFKHIAPYLVNEKAVIGGEESGGFGFWDHVPEKDGILSSLRLLEYMIRSKSSVRQLLEKFYSEFGNYFTRRTEAPLTDKTRSTLRKISRSPESVFERKVERVLRIDGVKIYFDDGWLLLRPSGTEPVVRIYSEASTAEAAEGLIQLGMSALEA